MYIDYLIKISNILGDILFIETKILQINSMKNGSAGLMITKTSSFRLSAVDVSSGLFSLSYSQAPPVSTPVSTPLSTPLSIPLSTPLSTLSTCCLASRHRPPSPASSARPGSQSRRETSPGSSITSPMTTRFTLTLSSCL